MDTFLEEQARKLVKRFGKEETLFLPNYDYNVFKALSTSFVAVDGVSVNNRNTLLGKRNVKKKLENAGVLDSKLVISVLVDALGFRNVSQSNTLMKLFEEEQGILLSSIYPTMTSAVLSAVAAGLPPEENGILGQKIYIDEIGNIVDFLTMQTPKTRLVDSLPKVGINVRHFLWSSMVYDELVADDDFLRVKVIVKDISKQGLSWIVIDDFKYVVGFDTLVDGMSTVKRIIEKYPDKKLLIELYFSELDSISHVYGPMSQEYEFQLKMLETHFSWLFNSLDKEYIENGSFFLYADHGQHELNDEEKIRFSKDEFENLREWMRSPPGRTGASGRAIHFYIKPEYEDDAIEWLTEKMDSLGLIIKTEDHLKELYPSLKRGAKERVLTRIGTIQAILKSGASIDFKKEDNGNNKSEPIFQKDFRATHGSLTLDELVVPFIFTKLSTLQRLLQK